MTPGTEPIDRSGSRALLIGVSTYQDPDFPSVPAAGNSLQGMRQMLVDEELGGWSNDQVLPIPDPVDCRRVMSDLRRHAQNTSGVLLLYFVGHGTVTENGDLVLAVSDTIADEPDVTGLEYSKIRSVLRGSPAKVKAVVLDCCYSGRVIDVLGGDGQHLADITAIQGAYTLTAADLAAHAGKADTCTAFTGELLDLIGAGVAGGPPVLTFADLYPHLRQRLLARNLPRPNQHGTDTADKCPVAKNASGKTPTTGQAAPPGGLREPDHAGPNHQPETAKTRTAAPSRRRRSWLIAGAAIVAAVLVAVTAYTLGDPFGDGKEAAGGDGSSGQQANKFQLVKPGTLTVAVDGVRTGSAHNLAAAANDSGWLDKTTVEDRDVFAKPGDWVGPDPDLATALGDRLGLRVKLVGIEVFGPSNPFELLGTQYDVVMPSSEYTSFDAEERQSVDFIHYFDYGYTVYAPWKTAQNIQSWADLCGMHVDGDEEVVQTASYKECGPKPIKQTSEDIFAVPRLLRGGSIDAVVTDLPYAVHEAKDSGGDFHLPDGDLVEDAPVGIAVDRTNTALRDALQQDLNALIDSGEYGRLLTKWGLEDGAITTAQIIRG
ncbi:caspase, EACC1-associated type [Streptomyces tailanensis]|uniref:caspase, EACC1-associated type n=1 Tax=Streptomyces tailanensis TaxID=2569858 RepID=UPI00122E7B29|nr:transporter substrate-binding domain-containing protein [Streptomyces tailanensis]